MKTGKVQNENPELRMWCEGCCIRIAPNEGRTVFQGKTYHLNCYSKLSTKSKAQTQAAAPSQHE